MWNCLPDSVVGEINENILSNTYAQFLSKCIQCPLRHKHMIHVEMFSRTKYKNASDDVLVNM